jgi:hypothetical protein
MSEITTDAAFDPVASRQAEVDSYTEAISMYQGVAATLPSEWPAHLVQFKGRTDTHAAIAEIDDLADVELVSQLWAHDQAQAAIRSNMVERAKAQAILSALLAQQ